MLVVIIKEFLHQHYWPIIFPLNYLTQIYHLKRYQHCKNVIVMCFITLWSTYWFVSTNYLPGNIPSILESQLNNSNLQERTSITSIELSYCCCSTNFITHFDHVLVSQLYKRIIQHIPSEQFGFIKGSNILDAGLSLASTIMSALNWRAEVRLVALDIKGTFDHVCWKGLLAHLWSIGFQDNVFRLFKSYLSDRYIKVVTSVDASKLHSISAVKHCLLIGYADDHTLLKIIPQKSNRYNAAAQKLYVNLAILGI